MLDDFDWVIFDCDGVILGTPKTKWDSFRSIQSPVDTESLYTKIGLAMIERYSGLPETSELRQIDAGFKASMMGRKKERCAEMMVEKFHLKLSHDEYIQISHELELELFSKCEPISGAEEIIQSIAGTGRPLALATGSAKNVFEIKQQAHPKLFEPFHALVVGDDPAVLQGKPAPDIFLEAARRISVLDPSRCLVIEDSPNGVKAALAAGMKVAWVPDQEIWQRSHRDLAHNPHVYTYQDLHNLKAHLFPAKIN